MHNRNNGPSSNRGGEKAKDFKGVLLKLFGLSKKGKIIIFVALFFAMFSAIFTLFGPNILSSITEEIQVGFISNVIDTDKIIFLGCTLLGIYVVGYLLNISQGLMISSVIQKTASTLRTNISQKINKLPMSFYSRVSKGEVLSRVTNDIDTLAQSLSQSLGSTISAVTLFVGSLVMMFITNWILAITAILSTIVGFVFIMIVMKKSQQYFKNQQSFLGEINGHIEEMYTGHTVVKAYNGEEKAKDVFNSINEKLKTAAFKAQSLSGLMFPMMGFIGNLGYVAVVVVGAILVVNNQAELSVIVAFLVYIRLFTQPLGQIAQALQNLQLGAAASERVFGFLEEKEMEDESDKIGILENPKGEVEFRNVTFGYSPDKTIIHNFSAIAKPGQKVAIVGPTGAGKTTIVNLLMRFFDIDSGSILIDGVDTNTLKREVVHSQFCMVLQDTWLFEGTLRENLVYSAEAISDKELDEVCKSVGLLHFVKTLPSGYDTLLNDSLVLSQGQKQQITIARAMIADKSMLILDEATSSVDTRTEIIIQKAMDELMSNRTSFVIAHRLSTIKNADLILVMKDGNIIEKGNHVELLSQNGFYAELYNSQFEQK